MIYAPAYSRGRMKVGIPKVGGSINGFMGFLTSPEAIAVASAIILTPFIAGYILPLVSRIPVIGNYGTVTLLVAALIVFLIAKWVGGGFLRSIFLGAAAGMVINAFAASTFGRGIIKRFGSAVST